ncbi:putative cyclophilin 8 [Leishmania major strain Friedlin]|uniref:Putative cyclophilin 8 n=1 Tax=Leishmania major TaxID=5664 RepID=Q4QAK0_LEIMA|nr:putative cyclophilin 8 [Leishmania major strain Friedlin]CAJ04951.1 putative cyclophilin 8 [Leishmania major strain Friedlin]|eukprot:XP_001683648.1 putative cyclophilin 8 [Leishmania major strain Friedlin]
MIALEFPLPPSTSLFLSVFVIDNRYSAFPESEEIRLVVLPEPQLTMPPRKAIAKMKSHSAESVDVDLQNCLLRIDKGTDVYGMLVIELDSGRSPKACELVGQNIPASNTTDKSRGKQGVYKNCRFSRLTKEGIQTGEVVPAAKPIPAAELEGEIGRVPHCYGAVSLCRSSTSFDGSQFFICLTSDSVELDHLNKKHVCFGRVVEGHDVLAALQSDLAEYSGDMGLVRKDCPYVMAELSYASM